MLTHTCGTRSRAHTPACCCTQDPDPRQVFRDNDAGDNGEGAWRGAECEGAASDGGGDSGPHAQHMEEATEVGAAGSPRQAPLLRVSVDAHNDLIHGELAARQAWMELMEEQARLVR